MKDGCETEEIKQAVADVLSNYSTFIMACIGNKVWPCDMRLHLMKEISGMHTFVKRETSEVVPYTDRQYNGPVIMLWSKSWNT